MKRYCAKVVFILAVTFINSSGVAPIKAQDFPYVAPSAPEFDGRGNLVREASKPSPQFSSSPQSRVSSQPPLRLEASSSFNTSAAHQSQVSKPVLAPQIPGGYGSSQDATPRPPRQASFPQAPDNRQRMTAPAPLASNPTQKQPQPTARQDCSQFPMLIATAPSEAEMQMAARRYLTCLIQNGWNMDQARQHVISTVESTYRLAR